MTAITGTHPDPYDRHAALPSAPANPIIITFAKMKKLATFEPEAINAALGAGCEVGPRALVEDCVIGEGTAIGADSSIREGAVVGGGCSLPERTRLAAGHRWEPEVPLMEAPRISAAAADSLRRRAISMEPAPELLAPVGH